MPLASAAIPLVPRSVAITTLNEVPNTIVTLALRVRSASAATL